MLRIQACDRRSAVTWVGYIAHTLRHDIQRRIGLELQEVAAVPADADICQEGVCRITTVLESLP